MKTTFSWNIEYRHQYIKNIQNENRTRKTPASVSYEVLGI